MRISTKGRYALMVLIDLAEQGQDKPVSLRSVAERQGISEKYLEGIVARLGAAKLVDSIRGKYGGYRLSKSPKEYTIIEISYRMTLQGKNDVWVITDEKGLLWRN